MLLTALEPDLGSAALLACVMGAMLFIGGVRLRYAMPMQSLLVPAGCQASWLTPKFGYIQNRIQPLSFLSRMAPTRWAMGIRLRRR